jgi:hypothetical protein
LILLICQHLAIAIIIILYYDYILNCIDVYSRYCWLRLLKKKEAAKVRDALIDIIETAGISPNVIQTDNGGEFKGEFDEYLRDHNISHLFSSTYSPNQNAIVERANKDIRKIINNSFAMTKTKTFYDIIDAVEEAKNNAYNSSIKCAPSDLWQPNKDIITKRIIPKSLLKPEDKKLIVAYENNQKALQKMEKYKRTDNFNVGDYVLIKMRAH